MNRAKIEEGVAMILRGLEVDPKDHNFFDTPKRVADVYQELFTPEPTGFPVFDEDHTDMVILRGHTFYTMCPHHLLPVKLTVSVAYIPNGKVIGASKLARMLHECSRRPETQEALTDKAAKSIKDLTHGTSQGEAVLMEGAHGCFEVRGVRSSATLITHKFSGLFLQQPDLQQRFFDLVRVSNGRR